MRTITLVLVFCTFASAQSRRFTGTVVDSTTNTVLENATIFIAELKQGVASDHAGKFAVELPEGRYTVFCRLLGYNDLHATIDLHQDVRHTFRLVPSEIELSEVKVEGTVDRSSLTASAQSVITMTPQDLDRHRGQTLGAALATVTGVTVLSTGPSIAKPVIHGLHSQRIRILNAGVPQEGQQWGGEHAPEIDPFAPAKIEVLKGVAGVEFGAGAIGGVINLQPRSFRSASGFGGELTLNGFANNRQGAASLLVEGGPDLFNTVAWRLQLSGRKAGSSSAPEYVIGNTGFSELNGSAAVGGTFGGVTAEAYFSHFGTTLGIYTGSHLGNMDDLLRAIGASRPPAEYAFTYTVAPPKQVIAHDLWSIHLSAPMEGWGTWDLQYGWQSNRREEYDGHLRSHGKPNFDLTLTTYSGDLKFRHTPTEELYGTIGISAMRQGNVSSGLSFLIPNFRSYSGGIYALETMTEGVMTYSAGARYDLQQTEIFPYVPRNIIRTTLEYHSLSGALGTIWQFQPEWSVAGNVSSGWRPPSVNELFSYGVHHGTAQFEIGDPSLHPERSVGVDITLKHRSATGNVEVSAYANSFTGFIFAYPSLQPTLTLRGIFPTMIYTQSDVYLRGLDASWEEEVVTDVRIGASFSTVWGTDVKKEQPLIQLPSDRMQIWSHLHLPEHLWWEESYLEVRWSGVAKQTRVPANADYLPPPVGYGLVDAEYGGEFIMGPHLVRFNLSVQNIFNHAYRDYLSRFRYFVDNPGRDIALRVHIPFGKSSVTP